MKKAPLFIGILMTVFFGFMILFRVIISTQDGIEKTSVLGSGNAPLNQAGKTDNNVLHKVSVNTVDVAKGQGVDNPEKASTLKMDANLTEQDWAARIQSGITDQAIHAVYDNCGEMFAFHSMKEEEKQLYAEIYLIITNHLSDVFICSINEKSIDYAYNCVLTDHPEIFYVDGYNYTRYSAGEVVQKIAFNGCDILNEEEIRQYEREIAVYEDNFFSGISLTASEYEKVKYTYEYVIRMTDYDESAPLNQTICSVMSHHRSVCQGYAKTVQYLLEKLGVKSTLVVGRTRNGENHSWNLVNIDGAYYFVDATWGDNSYRVGEDVHLKPGGFNYDYLCVTTQELMKTHVIDNVVPVPACISSEANYYVKEERYFTGMNEEKLFNAFQSALESGESFVSIKCSSRQVFDSMFQSLLVNQDIFRFVPNDLDSLNYTYNENLYTITFFL